MPFADTPLRDSIELEKRQRMGETANISGMSSARTAAHSACPDFFVAPQQIGRVP
jgi:hypothetical protein